MVPPPWSSTNALPMTSKDAGPAVSGGFPVRNRTMNHGSRSSSAGVGNVSQSRHTMVTPAERNTRSVSAFALATIGSLTPLRLHTATFICWPAASSSTEHRAVISSVLICASPPKPHPKGVRFALIRAILFRKTPTGAKKNGPVGFLADHWPVTPLGSGGRGMSERVGPPGGAGTAPHRPPPDAERAAGTYAADHRAGQRGLHEAGGSVARHLAESRAVCGDRRQPDAPHPGGSRPRPPAEQARRGGGAPAP